MRTQFDKDLADEEELRLLQRVIDGEQENVEDELDELAELREEKTVVDQPPPPLPPEIDKEINDNTNTTTTTEEKTMYREPEKKQLECDEVDSQVFPVSDITSEIENESNEDKDDVEVESSIEEKVNKELDVEVEVDEEVKGGEEEKVVYTHAKVCASYKSPLNSRSHIRKMHDVIVGHILMLRQILDNALQTSLSLTYVLRCL